ncbi:MAG: argininosuccinate lyase, partial [bacterium]
LVVKGVPFRDAHGIIGRVVLYCIEQGRAIEELSLAELKSFSEAFEEDLYQAVSMKTCVDRRLTAGGPAPEAMKAVIENRKEWLATV